MGPPLVSRASRSVLGLIAPDVDRVESISQYLRMEFEKGARSDRTLKTGALRDVSQAKILCCSPFKRARGLRVRQVTGRPGMESSIEPGEPFNHATPINRGARGAPNETLCSGHGPQTKKCSRYYQWFMRNIRIYNIFGSSRDSESAVKRCR